MQHHFREKPMMTLALACLLQDVKLADLGFMAGAWEADHAWGKIEEHWMKPSGNGMFGMARVVADEKTVHFEYTHILQRDGEITMSVQVQGAKAVPFKLIELKDKRAVFENKEHDFPQRIIYWESKDGLGGRIEGTEGGKEKHEEFAYRRMK